MEKSDAYKCANLIIITTTIVDILETNYVTSRVLQIALAKKQAINSVLACVD